MEGWIKLHRSSLNHWLYNESRPHTKREAWEDMLLMCNHEDTKVLIGGGLVDCRRGQSVMSLQSWAKQFNWTVQKVRTFFDLLESDGMINKEGLRKTTRITICKYDVYQDSQQGDNTENNRQTTGRQQGDNKEITTNKNEKKDKNEKKNISERKKDFALSLENYLNDYDRELLNEFYSYWTEHSPNGRKMRFEKEKVFDVSRRLATWKKRDDETKKYRTNNRNRFESDTTERTIKHLQRRIEQKG